MLITHGSLSRSGLPVRHRPLSRRRFSREPLLPARAELTRADLSAALKPLLDQQAAMQQQLATVQASTFRTEARLGHLFEESVRTSVATEFGRDYAQAAFIQSASPSGLPSPTAWCSSCAGSRASEPRVGRRRCAAHAAASLRARRLSAGRGARRRGCRTLQGGGAVAGRRRPLASGRHGDLPQCLWQCRARHFGAQAEGDGWKVCRGAGCCPARPCWAGRGVPARSITAGHCSGRRG
jgi:hypothetical protein